jgi:RNA polymerase sigma-70 factor (ECF subfamily)
MEIKDFKKFYDANFGRIYRYVAVRVADRATAEDLTSEIFLKALRAFGGYDEARSRSAWIFTIARNHLANHFRSAGREVTDEDFDDLPLAAGDAAEQAERRYDLDLMLRTLGAMPRAAQALIRMKYLEELTYGEMAERLGKDQNALKVATFRAMTELRAALRPKI